MKRLAAFSLVVPANAQAHSRAHTDADILHVFGAADHLAFIAVVVASAACTAILFWLRG